jgi:hypothetical protein
MSDRLAASAMPIGSKRVGEPSPPGKCPDVESPSLGRRLAAYRTQYLDRERHKSKMPTARPSGMSFGVASRLYYCDDLPLTMWSVFESNKQPKRLPPAQVDNALAASSILGRQRQCQVLCRVG